jgi:hypothetical protein
MLKKLLSTLLLLTLLVVTTPSLARAQENSCGDLYTVGKCADASNCGIGNMCKADGIWPWHWNFRCEPDPRCAQPIVPPNNLTADCGIERSVNGVEGCFADDNGLIQNGVSCQSGGNLCCRTAASCPAASDQPSGCGILTNGGSTCQINGQAVGSFQRCGQTQACCTTGISCPLLPRLRCGDVTEFSDQRCGCETGLRALPDGEYCCGWVDGSACKFTDPAEIGGTDPSPSPSPSPDDDGGTGGGTTTSPSPNIDIFEGPTSANFKSLNPLEMFGSAEGKKLTSPGAIISRMLLFAFPLAGLILFVMIVWGGFEMLVGATSKGIEAGKQRVTAAIVGFTLLFVAYWVFQIIEVIFGVVIL